MPSDRTLASPQHMVWQLFEALRRLSFRLNESHSQESESVIRQDAALCVILAVQCVEVFLNVYFRIIITEPGYTHAAEKIKDDLSKTQCGLDHKIKNWPVLVFEKRLSLDKGFGQQFINLKNLRHRLMHFTSSHEAFNIPGVTILGLSDVSVYNELSERTGIEALQTAEAFLCEVFTLRGIPVEDLPYHLHSWTGLPPMRV